MPFHFDLFAASTVSTVQWSGWKLFNLISAAEKWAENKNFKVHKFMRKISCCSHFFFFFTVINYTFLSESLLDCHRAKVMLLRTTTACIGGDDSVNQQFANIISQIWKSKFLFIFSLRWLSLQRTRNFHIFLKKKRSELTSKVDDVAMSIHAQRAQLFAARFFFLPRKKFWRKEFVMAEYITIYSRKGESACEVLFYAREQSLLLLVATTMVFASSWLNVDKRELLDDVNSTSSHFIKSTNQTLMKYL